MDRSVYAGSIQAAANYVRAGDQLGHTIAIYGHNDPRFPRVRFSTEVGSFDYVLFIIESTLRWMSALRLPRILSEIPRRRRAVLDADGRYNPVIAIDGYDHNHATEYDRSEWLAHCDLLADKILQPTFTPQEALALPFYGFDPMSQIAAHAAPPKRFDIVHVGHNWWRWQDVNNRLLPAFERVRPLVGDICFVGLWWDAVPSWAKEADFEAAFRLDNELFDRLGIRVRCPVPYTEVVSVMSEGRVNIMTQRPLFRHLRLLTSKYFEVFAADTIPLVMLDPDHAEEVYGSAGRELALDGTIDEKLLDALHEPQKYQEIVREVRHHLHTHHSYERRVQELVAALEP